MGFLDNVKDALKGAVSGGKSKGGQTAGAARTVPAPAEVAGDKFDTYTVKTGDTLFEICAREGVSLQDIARINNIENPDLIFPGQVFRIPKKN